MTATKLLTNDCRSEFVNSDGDWLPRSLDFPAATLVTIYMTNNCFESGFFSDFVVRVLTCHLDAFRRPVMLGLRH